MKTYHVVLTSLIVTASINQKAKANEVNAIFNFAEIHQKVTECKNSKQFNSQEECQLLENAFEQILKLNHIDSLQNNYLNDGVILEMQYDVMVP
jgi:hypothetical protein